MENTFTQNKMFFVQALTDIHCGTGQGVADIDLPTAKEPATSFPLIPGSSIKGVMRDYFRHILFQKKNRLFSVFGPDLDDDSAEAHASAIMTTDARILLLPVRSFTGVFAYVTCPLVLSRLSRDITHVGIESPAPVPDLEDSEATLSSNSQNKINDHLILEDLDLRIKEAVPEWDKWCTFLSEHFFDPDWGTNIALPRLALISNTVFSFLCETSLPVRARIRLDAKTGVVKKGALWYEESVPSETIFSGLIASTNSYGNEKMTGHEILNEFASMPLTLQLGGKATTGKGLCLIRFRGKESI